MYQCIGLEEETPRLRPGRTYPRDTTDTTDLARHYVAQAGEATQPNDTGRPEFGSRGAAANQLAFEGGSKKSLSPSFYWQLL